MLPTSYSKPQLHGPIPRRLVARFDFSDRSTGQLPNLIAIHTRLTAGFSLAAGRAREGVPQAGRGLFTGRQHNPGRTITQVTRPSYFPRRTSCLNLSPRRLRALSSV